MSGARTDDIVRVFIHVRHTAMKAVSFKRFVFFQMGAEKYNYHPNFAKFAYGSQQAEIDSFDRTCGVASNTAGSQTSRHYDNLYNSVNSDRNIYREELSGDGPWWFAFEDNQFQSAGAKKVGDKGLIVRSYDAVFNGTSYTHPSFSMLCDKVELGTPAGVTFLQQGDYVDMRLEFLVMPLEQDLDVAVTKSGTYNDALVNSKSLEFLNTFTSARDRVKAHATPISVTLLGGDSTGATIESEYPIRLRVSDGFDPSVHKLEFRVTGSAIGYVPILIGNLSSSHLAVASGLWSRPKDVGAYSPETAATTARQVNHVRGGGGGTYEMVFNVNEMGAFGTVEYTDYSFGADPNNDIIIL